MQKKLITLIVILLLIIPVAIISSSKIKNARFKHFDYIDLEHVSRYDEDRIAYQRIEDFIDTEKDNSLECLLVIRKRKMYLMKDGYDKPMIVKQRQNLLDMEQKLYYPENLWKNKINGKPDYVAITNRRVPIMTNNDENIVARNFGNFYKTIRNKFIKRHTEVFKQLMINRGESFFYVNIKPLPNLIYPGSKSKSVDEQKYSTVAKAKSSDGSIYYCEDADGDGITETFSVRRGDGFHWGYKSGPNIIFIYKNTNKDIEQLIGKLAEQAIKGTKAEEKNIIENFPNKKEISDLIDFIVPDQKIYR